MKSQCSKGSLTAKSGLKAEQIFRTDLNIKNILEKYFDKKIRSVSKIQGEKYDTLILFDDNSEIKIQNKKIENLGGRGNSFDRRHIKDTFNNQFIRKYLTVLSLIRKGKNETMLNVEQKKDFINLCNRNIEDIKQYLMKNLIGIDNKKNDYFCILKTNNRFSKIELYIINSSKFYEFLEKSINIDISLKKNGTCLHLSPHISLQRKGGGKTDKSPNHIQAKLKFTQEILNLFDKIL